MRLAGQGGSPIRPGSGQAGYAMVALLVGLSVMAVLMSAALPVWTQASRREKELELIWRGEQYARALELFQRKFANAYPPSIDVLVEQKFLRRKYKDPITGDDFQPIYLNAAQQQPGTPQGAQRPGQVARPAPGIGTPTTSTRPGLGGGLTGGTQAGPIVGVVSKSTESSIRLYNGRSHYNEWQFVYVQTQQGVNPGQGRQRPGVTPGSSFRPGAPGGPSRPPGASPTFPGMQMPGGQGQRPQRPPGN